MTNYPQLGHLKQQECTLSQFQKPEIQNQGAGRAMLPLKPLGENPSLSLPGSGSSMHSLACG